MMARRHRHWWCSTAGRWTSTGASEYSNGAIDCPGGGARPIACTIWHRLPTLFCIVNCAGRTRSIIGVQSLINAGVPHQVAALRNGTMGWHLQGYRLRAQSEPSRAGMSRPTPWRSLARMRTTVARRAGVTMSSTNRLSPSGRPSPMRARSTSSTCASRKNMRPVTLPGIAERPGRPVGAEGADFLHRRARRAYRAGRRHRRAGPL